MYSANMAYAPAAVDRMSPLITSAQQLPSALAASVSADEAAYIRHIEAAGGLPFAVTPHFASLAAPARNDPIRRQFMPDPREALDDPFALDDPLGEAQFRAAPRLVHQYRDRALLLAGGSCAGYCRYCFRRVRMSAQTGFISDEELLPVPAYLEGHREIREILISGGDPLTASDSTLAALFAKLRDARPSLLLRLCTRVPVTAPDRIAPETIALFARYRPFRIVVHINHPRELSPETCRALSSCVAASIPVHVQTVLLRGVNDKAEVLASLFRDCLDLGITPYYLFHLDLAPGTRHFRVAPPEGIAIYRELRTLISGLGLPAYAVDLPGGGGKIRLHDDSIAGIGERPGGKVYLLKDAAGRLWDYPADQQECSF
jgi:lysine 2,3-aminomutase